MHAYAVERHHTPKPTFDSGRAQIVPDAEDNPEKATRRQQARASPGTAPMGCPVGTAEAVLLKPSLAT
jgi:hypothetical protein